MASNAGISSIAAIHRCPSTVAILPTARVWRRGSAWTSSQKCSLPPKVTCDWVGPLVGGGGAGIIYSVVYMLGRSDD